MESRPCDSRRRAGLSTLKDDSDLMITGLLAGKHITAQIQVPAMLDKLRTVVFAVRKANN
jgi:hypothetical protein